jgi:hypothetical protein
MHSPKTSNRHRTICCHGTKQLRLDQEVNDFQPVNSRIVGDSAAKPVPDSISINDLKREMGEKEVVCTIHWMPDVEVTLTPSTQDRIIFRDQSSGEECHISANAQKLCQMDTTTLWHEIESMYVAAASQFRDPYLYQEVNRARTNFLKGSHEELVFGLTMLLYAFPKLYQRALRGQHYAPRVLVSSQFKTMAADARVVLWNYRLKWQATAVFHQMLLHFVGANMPTGSQLINPTLQMLRRSQFLRVPVILSIAPDVPSDVQIIFAREFLKKIFPRQDLTRHFDEMPLALADSTATL